MFEGLRVFFDSEFFMPHGHCYLWRPSLVWLNVLSDGAIGTAYLGISATLYALVRRIKLPFSPMILAFGLFIGACGLTHFMEVWNVWSAHYWLAGGVKAVTAVASVATGLFLLPARPRIVELTQSAQLSEERRVKLERSHRELESLYGRVKEVDRLKTDFFANVSHELRTPLALILGPVQRLMADESLSAAQREDLDLIRRNAKVLLRHVNDLLDTAKLEAGALRAAYSRTDVAALVSAACKAFEGLAAERRVDFQLDAPATLFADVDAEKLRRVVMNLVSNAFKFTPDGGRIRCALAAPEEPAGVFTLAVEDSGPGVKPEHREVIFERFRQAESGPARALGGTGLGLSIAREFVQLLHGEISVGTAPQGGARFALTLPRAAPAGVPVEGQPPEEVLAPGEPETMVRELLPPRSTSPGSSRPVVLLVEDNPDMRGFVASSLDGEFSVETARDGQEGLERLSSLRPDLVITDLMMPRLSGEDLVKSARNRQELAGVPILLLSARGDEELRVRLLREGAQDYLTKPFSVEELKARARIWAATKRTRDILERELGARTGELAELAQELGARKQQLEATVHSEQLAREIAERASSAKTTFLNLVSHELRTPLATLQLNVQMLATLPPSTPKEKQIREKLSRSTLRLMSLIESVLEFTRIEGGRLTVRAELLSLAELATEVVDELRPQAQQKELELILCAPSGLPSLSSDPRLVRLIVLNLVINAIKYTERGSVTVTVDVDGGHHVLSVRDTGMGIPKEAQRRVFMPFEQLEPIDRKHTPGVGLGLALVKEMTAALGGTLALESEVGQGSEFRVVLPSVWKEASASDSTPGAAATADAEVRNAGLKKADSPG